MGAHFFRHGELPLVILALLDARPMHGYDLLSELGGRFGPSYQPSPGSVYPAITALQEEGLIQARTEGTRRVYDVTPAGRRALLDRRDRLDEVEARLGVAVGRPSPVDELLDGFVLEIREAARLIGVAALTALLGEWRLAIGRISAPLASPSRDGSAPERTRRSPTQEVSHARQ